MLFTNKSQSNYAREIQDNLPLLTSDLYLQVIRDIFRPLYFKSWSLTIKVFLEDDRRKRKNIPRTLSAAHRFDYVRPCAHGWSQFSFFFSGRNLELFLAWIKLHFINFLSLWFFILWLTFCQGEFSESSSWVALLGGKPTGVNLEEWTFCPFGVLPKRFFCVFAGCIYVLQEISLVEMQ